MVVGWCFWCWNVWGVGGVVVIRRRIVVIIDFLVSLVFFLPSDVVEDMTFLFDIFGIAKWCEAAMV